MQVEDLFALFDASFDGLPAVVLSEPGGQVLGHRISAEVEQGAVLEGLAGVEAFQSHIQGVGALLEM
jgi:hypothetical protein